MSQINEVPVWRTLRDKELEGECNCGRTYDSDDMFCAACGYRLLAIVDQKNARVSLRDCYLQRRHKDLFLEAAVVLGWILHGPSFRQTGPFPERDWVSRMILRLAPIDDSTKVPNLAGTVREHLFDAREAIWGLREGEGFEGLH